MIIDKKITEIGKIESSDGTTLLRMWEVFVPSGKRTLQKHSHITFEIALVSGGSGIYTIGEKIYPMECGDMFIFASNEPHCITNVSENGLIITNLHFEPRYLWGSSFDTLTDNNINFCFSHNSNFANKIEGKNALKLSSLFKAISDELSQNKPEYQLTVKSLLNLFLITLIRDYGYSGEKSTLNRSKMHSIRRVIKYIDNNLSNDLSLKKLSETAELSPTYFSAVFHQVSGISLWDYINSRRIDLSIKFLREDNRKSVLDIATLCGFNNTANFNKTFKKITGLTPTEYINSENILDI